jgi:broad-specificity NMP kinase
MPFIALRGPSGVGKTAVAKALARKLGAEIIHIDEILDKHNLGYVEGQPYIPEENFFEVNRIIGNRLRDWHRAGKVVVIEGNFYHKSHIMDTESIAPAAWFTLNAPLATCVERDRARHGIGEKRIGNVYRNASRIEYGIRIDTEGMNAEEVADEIIRLLHSEEVA